MVLILDGNSEDVAHAWRKIGHPWEKKMDLWLLSIWSNALNRSNNTKKNSEYAPGPVDSKLKKKMLYSQFPYTPCIQICRIAETNVLLVLNPEERKWEGAVCNYMEVKTIWKCV